MASTEDQVQFIYLVGLPINHYTFTILYIDDETISVNFSLTHTQIHCA